MLNNVVSCVFGLFFGMLCGLYVMWYELMYYDGDEGLKVSGG